MNVLMLDDSVNSTRRDEKSCTRQLAKHLGIETSASFCADQILDVILVVDKGDEASLMRLREALEFRQSNSSCEVLLVHPIDPKMTNEECLARAAASRRDIFEFAPNELKTILSREDTIEARVRQDSIDFEYSA